MAGLSNDELAAFVAASCARSGVPVHVTDAAVTTTVAVLLLGVSTGRRSTKIARQDTAAGLGSGAGDGDVWLGRAV